MGEQTINRFSRSRVQRCLIAAGLSLLASGGAVLVHGATPPVTPIVRPSPVPALRPAVPPSTFIGQDSQLFGPGSDRPALLRAIDHSLRYLRTDKAVADYRRLSISGITRTRMIRSLVRFRQLVTTTRSSLELAQAINREFDLYQSTGKDGQGTVAFTGYFEPVHVASRVPTSEFRYPLFRAPRDLSSWTTPHPTRAELEGTDGLQFSRGRLRGLELVWLRDRLEAFLVQVQGSTRLQLTDGSTLTLGYAGHTRYPYTGIGRELVKDGKLSLEELTLARLTQYFQEHPADLDVYLPRNQRFIFFKNTQGAAATGSIGVPVTAERSIATDKTLFPPGGLALIAATLPYPNANGALISQSVERFVLDQDTGSAIKGAGRVDVFMGTGKQAGDRAGLINSAGKLYYLVLKP